MTCRHVCRRAGDALLLPGLLVLSWALACAFGMVNRLFVPSPAQVLGAVARLFVEGIIWSNLGSTVGRMLAGFFIGAGLAIPVGIVLGHVRRAYAVSEFLIDFTRSIPATALFPMFMLVWGVGDASKIAIVAFSCFFVILISSIYGVWNAVKTRILMARTLRATYFQIFTKIVVFDALPEIFGGLRNALAIALILTVVTEMFIGTHSGLGFLIFNAKIAYDTATMYAVIILLGMLGYGLNRLLLRIERRIVHWSRV